MPPATAVTTWKSSMSSTKGSSSTKVSNASTMSPSSSQRCEPVTGPMYSVPSALLSRPMLPGVWSVCRF